MRAILVFLTVTTLQFFAISALADQRFNLICSNRKNQNIKVLINNSNQMAALYTRASVEKKFVNNGKFECITASQLDLISPRSEIFKCGKGAVPSGRKLMGAEIFEMPPLEISNGYNYKITFLEENFALLKLKSVKLNIQTPLSAAASRASYELDLPCKSIDSRL